MLSESFMCLPYDFYSGVVSMWPLYWLMAVLLAGPPISVEDFWSSVRVVSGFPAQGILKLTDQALLCLARWTPLERVLVVPNFFPFHSDSVHFAPRNIQSFRSVFYTLAQICVSTQFDHGYLQRVLWTKQILKICFHFVILDYCM